MAVTNFLFVGRIFSKLKDDTLLPGKGNARIQIFCSWTFGNWTFQNQTQKTSNSAGFFVWKFWKGEGLDGYLYPLKVLHETTWNLKMAPMKRRFLQKLHFFQMEMVVPLSLLHGG